MKRNLHKIILILILLLIPISVSANQGAYSHCESKTIDNVKYLKLSCIAQVHKLTLVWNDDLKRVETEFDKKFIVFDTVNDVVSIEGMLYDFGDIKLIDGYTYIPAAATAIFTDDFAGRNSYSDTDNTSDSRYEIHTFDVYPHKEFISLNEYCDVNGCTMQWFYVNKYVYMYVDDKPMYFMVSTDTILINGKTYYGYSLHEKNDIIYLQKEAFSLFDSNFQSADKENPVETKPDEQDTPVDVPAVDEPVDSPKDEYISLSALAQSLKAELSWNDSAKSAIMKYDGSEYVFNTKTMKLSTNGVNIAGYAFKYENGFTYVTSDILNLVNGSGIFYEKVSNVDKLIFKSNKISVKSYYPLTNPYRIVIDALNFDLSEIAKYSGLYFSSIRLIKDDDISRIVVDLNGSHPFSVNVQQGYIELSIFENQNHADEQGKQNPVLESEKVNPNINNMISIIASKDSVKIQSISNVGYEISRKSGPDRLILFIPYAYCDVEKVDIADGSKYLKSISIRCDDSGTYITFQLYVQSRYEIEKRSDSVFTVDFYTQKILNLFYYNSSDRKYIKISGLSLSDEVGNFNSNVTFKNTDLTAQIVFFDYGYRLTAGVLYVNDEYLEKIQVKRNNEKVTLTIYAKQKVDYLACSERSSYTNINILPTDDRYKNNVIIDAGHGGSDPGAVYDSIYESNINLDVSRKVYDILTSQGISVFMIRDTDDFVGLYERALIANRLNAGIFVSIHTNAFVNTSTNGIMTLVYPGQDSAEKLTGNKLAKVIQSNLIRDTGAVNLGIIDRPNLVVLKVTKMPAVLVECGFMSNPAELAILKTEEYRNILANSIAGGIIECIKAFNVQ